MASKARIRGKDEVRIVKVSMPLDLYLAVEEMAEQDLRTMSKQAQYLIAAGIQFVMMKEEGLIQLAEMSDEEQPAEILQDAIGFRVDAPEECDDEDEDPEEDDDEEGRRPPLRRRP